MFPVTLKPESSRAQPRQKQCNCKHSRCLKLYCECFASDMYCDGCKCDNCYNNVENEPARREAIEVTVAHNPNAFRHEARDITEETGDGLLSAKYNTGCHCKKSGCLKKYCECFQTNMLCSEYCKCIDCKNFEGSEERHALFHGGHANDNMANAAIIEAIGSSGYGSPPPVRVKCPSSGRGDSSQNDKDPINNELERRFSRFFKS